MMTEAIVGGHFSAKVAMSAPQHHVRRGILGWAVCLTVLSFWRYH
jgi:hypothetical protein